MSQGNGKGEGDFGAGGGGGLDISGLAYRETPVESFTWEAMDGQWSRRLQKSDTISNLFQ